MPESIPAPVLTDLRRNLADESGVSWFVYDAVRERLYAGPFGDDDYAETVRKRASYAYQEDLAVGSIEASQL